MPICVPVCVSVCLSSIFSVWVASEIAAEKPTSDIPAKDEAGEIC